MRVFISYRRADMGGHAEGFVGRIFDRLCARFGQPNVFMDIGSIAPGQSFAECIREQVSQADILLAVIGPDWAREIRERSDQDDFVRVEIKAALDLGLNVIPVLVGGASIPAVVDLPESLNQLLDRNAFAVDSGRSFHVNMTELIAELESFRASKIIESGPFRAIRQADNHGDILKFALFADGTRLSYHAVAEQWCSSPEFRAFYCALFTGSGFVAYVWETPPINRRSASRDFELVLLNAPKPSGAADLKTYSKYFDVNGGDNGVVVFDNLGMDAKLVVPSPIVPSADYADMAAFFRNAPPEQHHALWRVVGRKIIEHLSDKPLWVSVAGGGIAWLHVRLDSRPKYYRHAPYRVPP